LKRTDQAALLPNHEVVAPVAIRLGEGELRQLGISVLGDLDGSRFRKARMPHFRRYTPVSRGARPKVRQGDDARRSTTRSVKPSFGLISGTRSLKRKKVRPLVTMVRPGRAVQRINPNSLPTQLMIDRSHDQRRTTIMYDALYPQNFQENA
jgi:hypothetical protein